MWLQGRRVGAEFASIAYYVLCKMAICTLRMLVQKEEYLLCMHFMSKRLPSSAWSA